MKAFRSIRFIRRGFTLIELITAMAITSILVLVIMQLTNQGIDLWNNVREEVSTTTRARAAMQAMSHDLESFQMRAGDNDYQWMFAKAGEKAEGTPKGLEVPRSAQVVFFACAPDRNPSVSSSSSLRGNYREARAHNQDTQGDVSAIGYRLMYRDQILDMAASEGDDKGVYPLFSLYRQVVPPRKSFEQLLGNTNLEGGYASFEQDDEKNFLCENIVEMNLSFTIRYANEAADAEKGRVSYQTVTVPVIASNNRHRKVAVYGDRIEIDGQKYENARVTSATISLTVLTEEGVGVVEQIRKGRRYIKSADFFAKYTRSFSRMVALPTPL